MTPQTVEKTWIRTGGSVAKGLDMNKSLKSHGVLLTFAHKMRLSRQGQDLLQTKITDFFPLFIVFN